MKNCGFSVAVPTSGISVSEICRDLEMADKTGMYVWVRDQTEAGFETIIKYAKEQNFSYAQTLAELNKRSEAIKANLDTYKAYSSFQGVTVYDEPSYDYLQPIGACRDWFMEHYPGYEFHFALLPVYAEQEQLFGTLANKGHTYKDYVRFFANGVKPTHLSYDHYPILRTTEGKAYIKDDFLSNLNVFAKQGKEYNIPVYVYLQTMGFYDNLPISTYEEFAWQCYTSMAFGVKGIMCFQYWTQLQDEQHNNVRGGIVDRDGSITPLYYEVQKVFQEIKNLENVYMHYQWDGVKTFLGSQKTNEMFDKVDEQLTELEVVREVNTNRDLIIGQFKDSDLNYAYMVTNASSPFKRTSAKVTLTFKEDCNRVLLVKKKEKRILELENHTLNMEIGSGEGWFVVPIQ